MKTWYLIPARKDSKGIKYKNRKLFNYTAIIFPNEVATEQVIVSSNDNHILEAAAKYGFSCIERNDEISRDNSSMKDVLLDAIARKGIEPEDDIVLLYLTYPQRKWRDVEEIYRFYRDNGAKSLSCSIDVADHPYLCFYEVDDIYGRQVVPHTLYRRQDYPRCFRQSLFVGIFKASEVPRVNDSLLCEDTVFFKLKRKVIDIDHDMDMVKFEESDEC